MPVPSWSNKAESKYNVTTEFPHLGLHSAAATGNIGLVKYALSHGQPINSVLDGVLPLHAACSGGNDLVVKLLVEHGADVNAPRLPRRYSNDKNRDASAPIVGTSGSTPLHFAAANGHLSVINTLFLHGAHADRPDKHGITPEMLARQNGWLECAELLHERQLMKDKELFERQDQRSWYDVAQGGEGSNSTRLKVKRSIDNAFLLLKSSSSSSQCTSSNNHSSTRSRGFADVSPSPTDRPPGEGLFHSPDGDFDPNDEIEARRPSLPHRSSGQSPPPKFSPSSPRRPHSAGTDAEPILLPRRVGSKYSLMNLFKKAQLQEPSSFPDQRLSSPSPSHTPASPPLPLSVTNSPVNTTALLSSSPNNSSFSSRFRLRSGSEAPSQQHPLSLEQQDSNRQRSGSGASIGVIQEHPFDPSTIRNSPPGRPGILRGQSAQLDNNKSPSIRALRFDPAASSLSRNGSAGRSGSPRCWAESTGTSRLQDSGNQGSPALVEARLPQEINPFSNISLDPAPRDGPRTPESHVIVPGEGTDSGHSDEVQVHVEDEEEYGSPIERLRRASGDSFAEEDTFDLMGLESSKPRLELFASLANGGGGTVNRARGQSFASSLSSLSPILDVSGPGGSEFPFSINRPPVMPASSEEGDLGRLLTVPAVVVGNDNGTRGDSVSGEGTDGSGGTPVRVNEGSSNASNVAAPPLINWEDSLPHSEDGKELGEAGNHTEPRTHPGYSGLQNRRRPQAPLDINIRSISSHAQAEALVQATQQSIFEMAGMGIPAMTVVEDALKSAEVDYGRTPLSAKLAAYGESLLIKRRLEEEAGRKEKSKEKELEGPSSSGDGQIGRNRGASVDGRSMPRRSLSPQLEKKAHKFGINRQASLGFRPTESMVRNPRRPRTSEGESPEEFSSNHAHEFATHLRLPSRSRSSERTYLTNETARGPSQTPLPAVDMPLRGKRSFIGNHRPRAVEPELDRDPLESPPESPIESLNRTRDVASTNKLTKMGFSASPTVSINHSPAPPSKTRFGLKSLMQTIKGRT